MLWWITVGIASLICILLCMLPEGNQGVTKSDLSHGPLVLNRMCEALLRRAHMP